MLNYVYVCVLFVLVLVSIYCTLFTFWLLILYQHHSAVEPVSQHYHDDDDDGDAGASVNVK